MAGLLKDAAGPFWYILRNALRQVTVRIDRSGQFVEITKGQKSRQYSFDQIEAELEDAKRDCDEQ